MFEPEETRKSSNNTREKKKKNKSFDKKVHKLLAVFPQVNRAKLEKYEPLISRVSEQSYWVDLQTK